MTNRPTDQQRQAARSTDCPVPGIPAVFSPPPSRPKANTCAPPETPPDEVFRKLPRRRRQAQEATPSLAPLRVGSPAMVLRCRDYDPVIRGPYGDDVVMAAGAVEVPVNWQTELSLSSSQIAWLAGLDQDSITLLSNPAATASEMAAAGRLTDAQAQALLTLVQAASQEAGILATAQGEAELNCQWGNAYMEAVCPAGALPFGAAGAVNPAIVPAGAVLSRVSQSDADDQARLEARSALVCRWHNAEVTATCQTLGFADPVPNDTEATPYGLRIGSVTVPAGTVTSETSQADADSQALELAKGSLRCFWLNARQDRACADENVSYVDPPVLSSSTTANAALGERGNPVMVPEGTIMSETSQADADLQALQLARASLECQWGNDEVTATCQPQLLADGTSVPPSDLSPVSSVTIPANAVTSQFSKYDANEIARLSAEFQLGCLYCNPELPPQCVPDSALQRLAAEALPLPIPAAWPATTWSTDATPGVRAGTYCASSAQQAIDTAAQLAAVPFNTTAINKCRYVNTEQKVACVEDAASQVLGKFTPAEALGLSPKSVPPPYDPDVTKRYLVISRGVIEVYANVFDDLPEAFRTGYDEVADAATAYANQLAVQTGLSILTCFFDSQPKTFTCKEKLSLTDEQAAQLHPSGSDNIELAEGQFTSLVSLADANASRDAFGRSALFCLFTNRGLEVRCYPGVNTQPNLLPPLHGMSGAIELYGDGTADTSQGIPGGIVSTIARGHPGNPAIIPADSHVSYRSPEEARQLALSTARSLLDCYWTNPDITVLCGASPLDAHKDVTTYAGADDPWGAVDSRSTGTAQSPVLVPAHQAQSRNGIEDAIRQAIEFGRLGLDCFWSNDEATSTCPPPSEDNGEVKGTLMAPSSLSSYTVAAGLFPSYVSKADADAQALAFAIVSKYCLYENKAYPAETPICELGMSVPRAGLRQGAVSGPETESVRDTAYAIFKAQGGCVDDLPGFQSMLAASSPEDEEDKQLWGVRAGTSSWRVTPGNINGVPVRWGGPSGPSLDTHPTSSLSGGKVWLAVRFTLTFTKGYLTKAVYVGAWVMAGADYPTPDFHGATFIIPLCELQNTIPINNKLGTSLTCTCFDSQNPGGDEAFMHVSAA